MLSAVSFSSSPWVSTRYWAYHTFSRELLMLTLGDDDELGLKSWKTWSRMELTTRPENRLNPFLCGSEVEVEAEAPPTADDSPSAAAASTMRASEVEPGSSKPSSTQPNSRPPADFVKNPVSTDLAAIGKETAAAAEVEGSDPRTPRRLPRLQAASSSSASTLSSTPCR